MENNVKIEVAKQIDLIRPLNEMYSYLEEKGEGQHVKVLEALTTARLHMIEILSGCGLEMRDVSIEN